MLPACTEVLSTVLLPTVLPPTVLQFKRRLLAYLEEAPQRKANPEAILCDHRPYFCNAGG